MGDEDSDTDKPRKKVWKRIRPKKYKIADKVTLQRIINPPPRYPVPEFKGQEYVHGPDTDSEFVFMCNEPNCTAKFSTALGLKLHSNRHLDPNIKCSFCGMTFKNEDDRAKHNAEFHPDLERYPGANPFQCQKCKKVSRDAKALWRHVRESHRDRTWPCPQCKFPFTRPENLKQHLETHHLPEGTEKLKCQICDKEYRHKNSLRLHIRSTHRGDADKSYRCVICNTLYYNKQCYKQHIKRHASPKYFPCLICNVKFMNTGHLKRHEASKVHLQMARKAKRKKSNIDDAFHVPQIKAVKTAKNPNLTKEQLVELCKVTTVKIILRRVDQAKVNKSIVMKQRIKKIKRKMKGDNREKKQDIGADEQKDDRKNHHLNCVYCDKKLPDLGQVKFHEKICYMRRRCSKVTICSFCDMTFDKPYKLRIHIRKHTNERPFKCSFCDATFKCKTSKYLHVKHVHFDIRKKPKFTKVYRCNYTGCGRRFCNPTGLKQHISWVHMKQRHTCEKCGRTFSRDTSLRNHLRNVHVECPTMLQCKPCGRMYKGRVAYLNHLQKLRHSRKTREYHQRREKRRKARNLRKKTQDENNTDASLKDVTVTEVENNSDKLDNIPDTGAIKSLQETKLQPSCETNEDLELEEPCKNEIGSQQNYFQFQFD